MSRTNFVVELLEASSLKVPVQGTMKLLALFFVAFVGVHITLSFRNYRTIRRKISGTGLTLRNQQNVKGVRLEHRYTANAVRATPTEIRSSRSSTEPSRNTSTEEIQAKVKEAQALLQEIVEILFSTGFATGVQRSLQVAQAANVLVREVTSNPQEFIIESNKLNLPRLVRRLFEELGATYIKLGQFIASSPTLFPAEYVMEFQACLDNSPQVPFSVIKETITSDLGKPLNAVFKSVEEVPLASASIAQVHRATMLDGREVVIKVRKPSSEATLKADLGFLLVTSKLLEFVNPSLSRLSLANIVGDIRSSMLDELDFTKEAKNLEDFRSFLKRQDIVDAYAPEPFLSTRKVLVMEYLKGVPMMDLQGMRKYSDNPEATLITALQTWAASVVNNETFHADVHGGNILVLEDGRVGFIDFGIVGHIPPTTWDALNDVLSSIALNDWRGVAAALVAIGATDERVEVDVDKFGRELESVVDRVVKLAPNIDIVTEGQSGAETSVAANLSIDENEVTAIALEIVKVTEDNGVKLPREFGILIKQTLYFDRFQKLLAPTLDPLRDDRIRSSLKQQPKVIDTELVEEWGGVGG